jgi:hypothetical protein
MAIFNSHVSLPEGIQRFTQFTRPSKPAHATPIFRGPARLTWQLSWWNPRKVMFEHADFHEIHS